MNTPRYIFGNGEVLTGWTSPPPRGPGSDPAYTFDEALSRIGPMVAETATTLAELPEPACPRDEVVASLTLHPQALAKSYHPKRLLDSYNLRQIGSRAIEVTPGKWTKAGEPQRSPSTELYIAGTKADFHNWATDFRLAPESIHDDIRRLECVRAVEPEDRLRHLDSASAVNDELLIELLIHASPDRNYILDGLEDWASSLEVNLEFERRLFAGGLCFIPAMVQKEKLGHLAKFSFLRVARPLSQMRDLPSIPRSVSLTYLQDTPLPNSNAVDDSLKVAVFDGGLRPQNKFSRWVTSSEPGNLTVPSPALQDHGHDVTSAVLFGPLAPGRQVPPPFSLVV